MKKLILFLILLTGAVFAQSNGKIVGGGFVWSDSLYYENDADGGDSTNIYNMNFNHDNYQIIFEGASDSTADSSIATLGTVRYSDYGVPIDTIWGNQIGVKDSSGTVVNTMINNTIGTHYIFSLPVQLLKIELINTVTPDDDRKVDYIIQAK